MEAIRGDLITGQLKRFGAHQRNELAMLCAFLRPGDRVLDVGAHIGTFTVPLAQRVGPTGRLDAFEGLAAHVAILERNVQARGWSHVGCHHALIGSASGGRRTPVIRSGNSAETRFAEVRFAEVRFAEVRSAAVRFEGVAASPDASQVTPPEDDGEDGPAMWSLDAWWRPEEKPVDLIKIDVEGMEWEVLEGAAALFDSCRPMLYMEVHRRHLEQRRLPIERLDELLRRHGYHLFRNLAWRNGRSDRFLLGRHRRLAEGGDFFDVLAIPATSERYPRFHVPPSLSRLWVEGRRVLGRGRRRFFARRAGLP